MNKLQQLCAINFELMGNLRFQICKAIAITHRMEKNIAISVITITGFINRIAEVQLMYIDKAVTDNNNHHLNNIYNNSIHNNNNSSSNNNNIQQQQQQQ